MEEFPGYIEEEEAADEGMEGFSPRSVRQELIEYLLRRYGSLQARDIARALGCQVKVVRQSLRQLEHFGRVKRTRLGRSYVWHPVKEQMTNFMYL